MHQDKYSNPYFYKVLPGVWDVQEKAKELSKEEKLKRLEDYIEKFNIEHDEKYIYLYKAVNVDGTNIHNQGNTIVYEVGKVYTEKCDQDINQLCSNGLHAGTYKIALDFGKGNQISGFGGKYSFVADYYLKAVYNMSNVAYYNEPNKSKPINPRKLYNDFNFRIFKVKIYKEHVVVPKNTDGKIRCNQMEIIEEVKLEPKLTYTLLNIELCDTEKDECTYEFTYEVNNKLNNQKLKVEFTSTKLDLNQVEIIRKIRTRIDDMQNIYDKFEELSKFDGNELI